MAEQEVFVLKDGQHHPLGPSAGERWMECGGSALLTIDMPDTDSEYSTLGTAAHQVTEWAREEGQDAAVYLGRKVEVPLAQGGSKVIVVDQEMVDATNAFSEYTDALGGKMLCEEQVCYDAWVQDAFGTADDIRLQDGEVCVTDYKYGVGVQVWAENNTQLKLYALGVWQTYGHLYNIDSFRLAVFQPRLGHVDEWSISVEDLLVWANTEVRPRAAAALKPGAPFKAGDWCQFCKAKQTCKTRTKYIHETAYANDFDDEDEDPRVAQLMTPDEIAKFLPRLADLRSFANDLEKHALSLLAKGEAIVHPEMGPYKMVAGRSNRVFAVSEEEVVEQILSHEDSFIEKKELYGAPKLLGPASIEKLLGKKHPLMSGDDAIVKKPQGKPVLATGIDKRQALEVNAEEEFGDD
jgi:hypothetical protein